MRPGPNFSTAAEAFFHRPFDLMGDPVCFAPEMTPRTAQESAAEPHLSGVFWIFSLEPGLVSKEGADRLVFMNKNGEDLHPELSLREDDGANLSGLGFLADAYRFIEPANALSEDNLARTSTLIDNDDLVLDIGCVSVALECSVTGATLDLLLV